MVGTGCRVRDHRYRVRREGVGYAILVTASRSGQAKPQGRLQGTRATLQGTQQKVQGTQEKVQGTQNRCRVRATAIGYALQSHGHHHSQEPFVALGGALGPRFENVRRGRWFVWPRVDF